MYLDYTSKARIRQETRHPVNTPIKTSMLISTDFKNSYQQISIGKSQALDAVEIVRESDRPIGCVFFDANSNTTYICDYDASPVLKERVRTVLETKVPVDSAVKNAIVEILVHEKIVRLNARGRPEKCHGLSNPPVTKFLNYLSAFNGEKKVLTTSNQCLSAFQHFNDAVSKQEIARRKKALVAIEWYEGHFDQLAIPPALHKDASKLFKKNAKNRALAKSLRAYLNGLMRVLTPRPDTEITETINATVAGIGQSCTIVARQNRS